MTWRLACVALACAALLGAQAPPQIPPAVASVLAGVREASGGAAIERLRSLHLVERVTASGISGDGEEWDDVATGRYAQSMRLGPYSQGDGFDGTHAWLQDASGDAWISEGYHDVAEAQAQAYLVSLSYLIDGRRHATFSSVEQRSDEGRLFHVVHGTVLDADVPIELWIDAKTHRLARVVERLRDGNITTQLSDYRVVDGVAVPFTQRNVDFGNVTVTRVLRADANGAIDEHLTMPRIALDDYGIAHDQQTATIPFEVVNNHIYLDAMVDGKGPFRFIFDTGGANIITPEVAQQVGIRATRGAAWVSEVRLGAATVRHQSFAVFPLGRILQGAEGVHIDGMVGFEVLRRFVISIDYANRTMTLALHSAGPVPPGVAVPFVFDERIILANASVDGLEGRFIVDTGNRASLGLYGSFVAQQRLREKYQPHVEGVTGYGIGGPTYGDLTRVHAFEIGGMVVRDPVTALSTDRRGLTTGRSIAGNVGGGILKRFTVSFDDAKQLMYLEKNAGFDDPDVYDRSGLFLVERDGGVSVISALTGSPAASAGLHRGDHILTVDGQSADSMGLVHLRELLKDPPGTELRLTIESAGRQRSIVLTLRDYV